MEFKLTPKENYLRVLNGQIPERIPVYTFVGTPDGKSANALFEPPVINGHRVNNGGKDIWGVEYIATYETGGALIPKTSDFILDDITKWRDVIKAPDLSGVDWERMVKEHFDNFGIDRTKTAVSFNLHFGFFQTLMSFMGFSEGLLAMYEEPEEVYALMDYLCNFYCDVAEKCIDYYKPDIFTMMDDTAALANPFISLDMYRELLLPFYKRQAKFAHDRGLPINFHNCGKCEIFVDDMVDFGVNMWDPAQTCNDLLSIKQKYGRKLALCGCWNSSELLAPDVPDEAIRASLKKTIDTFAADGGYCFSGAFLGPIGDPVAARKNKTVFEFVAEYGATFYQH